MTIFQYYQQNDKSKESHIETGPHIETFRMNSHEITSKTFKLTFVWCWTLITTKNTDQKKKIGRKWAEEEPPLTFISHPGQRLFRKSAFRPIKRD